MKRENTSTMSAVKNKKQNNDKAWKLATAITSVAAIGGVSYGIFAPVKLINPLKDVDPQQVDSFVVDGQIKYGAQSDSATSDEQASGWDLLLGELNIVCHSGNSKAKGSDTAHTKVLINMKNGESYNLEWLGSQNRVDITTPDGKTKKYQCYHE